MAESSASAFGRRSKLTPSKTTVLADAGKRSAEGSNICNYWFADKAGRGYRPVACFSIAEATSIFNHRSHETMVGGLTDCRLDPDLHRNSDERTARISQ